jgi:hypothetical protein
MAIAQGSLDERLSSILEAVAQAMARRSIAIGDEKGGPAPMSIVREENVTRLVQVYWTPFQAEIPGVSVGLHLNIEQPTKHWVEGYISPRGASWIFCFHTRGDGEYQLAYYRQQNDWRVAVEEYFDLAAWYALTPCDLTWDSVTCTIDPAVGWTEGHTVMAGGGGEALDKEVADSLKKSTIVWLKWADTSGAERTMPVWYIQQNDKLYLISGERQQTIPGIRELRRASVIVRWRGHANAQVAELQADVRLIGPGPEWDAIAEKLAEKRLNTPGAPEDTAARWRDECDLIELTLH